ncbi:NAD-dependent epimerase/dehydratase family protein [Oecophyllibacter saccharovorans]|uniref:NAD-dependent epimerase/dehydratase family protein n=1 Tax=Oecophyllibacter saccharovorans TaxID=2558360 RepID=UPI001168F26A|nr:NAD(P)-dependent oxidoreductase [Oecophyllibacter saccharovorans]TPW34670.1 NAD(P)-dependent oxidoreductase [Oecophyllibacter saccharovorans]
MKILIAGATGALGRPLVRKLVAKGYEVWGLGRKPEGLAWLREQGAHAAACNVLDAGEVEMLCRQVQPEAIINLLSALPADPFQLVEALPADAHLRLTGSAALLAAATACGARRYLQQSSGFYLLAPAGQLATEQSPFRVDGPGSVGESARMYATLEERLLAVKGLETTALRYGFLYGPGTWYTREGVFARHLADKAVALIGKADGVWSFVEVEDAAEATARALTAPSGIYDITDSTPLPYAEWLNRFAAWVHAPPPPVVSLEEGREKYGEETVYYENELSGADNTKARTVLGFAPRKAPWLA